jgi:hypothetical protein
MYQQVNLYQPIFREQQKLFSANTILIALAAVAGGMLAIGGMAYWRVSGLERQVRELKAQEKSHQRLLTGADALAVLGDGRKVSEEHLKALAGELERRRQALQYLRAGGAGGRTGFAARMEALAHQQMDGLWIRAAVFTADPTVFALSGSAFSADLVPAFLSRLAAEPALAGVRLDDFEIRQPEKPTMGELDFSVSSSKSAAPKSAAAALAANAPAASSAAGAP